MGIHFFLKFGDDCLHIATSYVAFAALLIHSRARADTWLTATLTTSVWIVMVSGVVGFYGQKLLYRIMPFLVKREVGRERLAPTRTVLEERGLGLIVKLRTVKADEAAAPPAAYGPLETYFQRALPGTIWLFTGGARKRRAENLFRRLVELTASADKAI